MKAGSLDRRITILRASVSRNSFNEELPTWNPMATVWAGAVPVSAGAGGAWAGERQRAGETLATSKYRFTVRHSAMAATVDPRDRIKFEDRLFDVNGVKEIGRREGYEITATARAEHP
jgi:SPP1 family predicted phage head-tail adaptor